jgi:hypothetical protein
MATGARPARREFGVLWHSSEKFDRVGWMLASIEYSWPEKLRFNRGCAKGN